MKRDPIHPQRLVLPMEQKIGFRRRWSTGVTIRRRILGSFPASRQRVRIVLPFLPSRRRRMGMVVGSSCRTNRLSNRAKLAHDSSYQRARRPLHPAKPQQAPCHVSSGLGAADHEPGRHAINRLFCRQCRPFQLSHGWGYVPGRRPAHHSLLSPLSWRLS